MTNVQLLPMKALLASAVACCLAGAAGAAQTPDERHLECVAAVYPPYTDDKDGGVSGIAVEMLKEVGRRSGVEIVVNILPFARIEAELRRGADSSVACAYAFGRTVEREAYMLFTTVPLATTAYTLYAKAPRSTLPYAGVEALKGARVGVRTSFVVPDALLQAVASGLMTLDYGREDELNFRKLVLDRVDYVLANQDVGSTMIRRLALVDVKAVQPPLAEFPTYIVLKKSLVQAVRWRELIDRGLAALRGGPFERQLREQYLR
jgi:ABC-type amino acid transport substrate-binding protein